MSASANADSTEIDKFHALAHEFWDPAGAFGPLHLLNPLRLDYVAARVSLEGQRVLDVGCGGGLLAEALARRGARVMGIDLAPGMIEVARLHASEEQLSIDYQLLDVQSLAARLPGQFDAITCMELIEHVPEPQALLGACATLLRPGGTLTLSTISRTPRAFLLAIVGAEYLLRLLPRGTHEYARFLRPAELAGLARNAGLALRDVSGVHYNPFSKRCTLGGNPDVNYLAHFEREAGR